MPIFPTGFRSKTVEEPIIGAESEEQGVPGVSTRQFR